jgi:hypothetical protein
VRFTGKYTGTAGGMLADTTDKRTHRNPGSLDGRAGQERGLVGRDLWERAQRTLARNKKFTTPHVNGGEFLLTGLLVCGHRGSRLSGRTFAGKRYYQCNLTSGAPGSCLGYTIAQDRLVNGILRTLNEGLYAPETVARLERSIEEEAAALEAEAGPAATRGPKPKQPRARRPKRK